MPLFRLRHSETLARLSQAGLLGLLIGAAGLLVAVLPAGEKLEEDFGLAWLFALRGPAAPPAEVVVVAIDERSASDLGLQSKPSMWPRGLHAELVRYLAKAEARVVCFDLTFEAPSIHPGQDQEFAHAIRSAGNVLLAESFRRDTISLEGLDGRGTGSAVVESRLPPIPALAEAALGSAPFLLPKESRVDIYWTFLDSARTAPTLPVLAFLVFGSAAFQDAGSAAGAQIPSGEQLSRFLQDASAALPEDRRRLARSLVELYSATDSRYLNYYGPPRTIATVSYSEVLAAARSSASTAGGKASGVSFKDKAVFVGYAATTPGGQDRLRDDYRTVYSQADGLDLSGVEIAATAFANLVEGRVVQPVGREWQLLIAGVWGLLLGLVCRLARPIFATLVAAALSGCYLWVVLERFVDATLWLPSIVPVGIQVPLALFAGVWLSYRDTRREREVIRRNFGLFLPSAVVDQLTRDIGPVTRANQVLFGACLSTDAEKYTSLAERMEPGRLAELMNEYYAQMFVPVERWKGVVADVVGDSMVAVWARRSSDFDVRRNACRATLEIAKAMEEFNAVVGDRPSLLTRFGLHSGDMLFGNIGASGHYEYRAVGDIVNTASRIQGLNKVLGTRILASAETVQGLEEFSVRPLGSFLLAGKANPVSIVELMGASHQLGALEAGRRSEFAGALQAYAEGRWREAAATFARILQADPDDGPARFYATHCARLEASPPEGEWSPTIRVEGK